ncbi:MAG: ATP-binding cassette domain-containing protein [Actinomycetia bacterium]|nr:ATP-binding cassette domain-containing protein [Actinomycetes bacterium]MCP4086352.1 ATP-binding cassette domain-containing protein [Actinomycetes bacterium]
MAGTGTSHLRSTDEVLLQVEDLVVEFPLGGGKVVHAVSGISFDIAPGETLGLVGESGCGKSTTGRAVLQLPVPTSGRVQLGDTDLTRLDPAALRARRTDIQMIFQDPISSLNPRRTIGEIVAEPLKVWGPHHKDEQWKIVANMLDHVGIDPDVARYKRPHEFSGGQCQRISIARALVLQPEVIICDEPVSALDVSVQAQILNLLEDLKAEYGLTLVFIAHDLAVVKNISDRVAVMYLGKMCEISGSDELHANPAHPYTDLLLNSIPVPDPSVAIDLDVTAGGELPSPIAPPSGCRFRTRCPRAEERCAALEPIMQRVDDGHYVACHFPLADVVEAEVAIS